MQIDEIKVSAGRTFNHPFESYSNLRCDVHLNAKLDTGEDASTATKQLQAQAEELAERHKESLLKNIRDLERIARANEEVSELERRIAAANARIKELRESTPALPYHSEPDAAPWGEDGSDHVDDDPL